jgi:hypothetical protein
MAKDEAPFQQFRGQMAAELDATREDAAISVLGRRKCEAARSLPEVDG